METPADRLKAARLRAGFSSATDAAKAFGWTVSTYLGHENGSRGLQVDAAQRYARAFKVPWLFLISGEKLDSGAEAVGTPVMGYLGGRRLPLPSRDEVEIIPVGAEGYDYSELAAFITHEGPPMEYVIVCTIPGQPIIIGDEILVSIDSPSGRNFETYTIGRQSDGSEWYYGARGIHPEDDSIFTMDEFYKIPGIRLEGVVVAVYQDKQRRRAIEASDLWPKTTQNALT